MLEKLEIKAREVCAWCNFCQDCGMCSDYGVDFNPHTCGHWKWYLPFPLYVPQKIKWRIKNL